jgi:radical SAM superfamily enzyme YgiQ (UPF0313 family)
MMYKRLKFEAKALEDVKKDIDTASEIYKKARTVFIADSDSLVMKGIEEIIRHIRLRFPDVARITSYARAKTLMKLGAERLKSIKEAGLTRVHVGLESGDPDTLKFMQKGVTPEEIIAGGRAAREAGLELSFYILVGAGGKDRLEEHAVGSARVCNEVNPDFIRLRTLVVQHGSLLEEQRDSGRYNPSSPIEKLHEVRMLLKALEVQRCEFASDHLTNNIWVDSQVVYSGVYGMLPEEKQKMLGTIDRTIDFLKETDGVIADANMLYEQGLIDSL